MKILKIITNSFYSIILPFKIYFESDFKPKLLASIFIFLFLFSIFEYIFNLNKDFGTLGVISIFLIPFFVTVCLIAKHKKNYEFVQSKFFWILSFLILLILIANDEMKISIWIARSFIPEGYRFIGYKILKQFEILIFYLIPFLLWNPLKRLQEPSRNKESMSRLEVPLSSYLFFFIPMIFVTILISFHHDFRLYYPIVPLDKPEIGYVATLQWIIAFEIFYILAFIATEWFFRGFIIREFETFLGKESILLMLPLYVSIHFGKPFLETISSMFGGFVLGILSYYTGNIRGGVLLHIGIAMTMEIMGFYWIRNLK